MASPRVGRIDFNLLLALDALLEQRNVTHAAERVGMSQPAMSAALARLRAHFDDELLVRAGRAYDLSPMAEQMQPTVREAVGRVDDVLGGIPAFDPDVTERRFLVSLSDYALSVVVEPLLSLVAQRSSRISVEFDPLPPDSTDGGLHLLRRDVLVGVLGAGLPGRRRLLFRDEFVGIVDRDNPVLAAGTPDTATLLTLPHAAPTFGEGTISSIAGQLRQDAGPVPTPEVTVEGLLPLPFTVAGTDLCAFVPARLAARTAGSLGLVVVPIAPTVTIEEASHWHPSRSRDPGLSWLLGILDDVARALDGAGVAATARTSV